MEDDEDLSMAAMPPGGGGLAGVSAQFDAALPRMLAEGQQAREAAYKPLRSVYEAAAKRLSEQRKAMPWHRMALAVSEGLLAPMQYRGIGAAMGNVLQRVNPLLDEQRQRSSGYDKELLSLMQQQAKLDAELASDNAKDAQAAAMFGWRLKRDANKTQYIQVKDPVTGELRIVPVDGSPKASGAPRVVSTPEEAEALKPGTLFVVRDDPQQIVRTR